MLSPQRKINDLELSNYCSYALKSVNLTVPAMHMELE